MDRVPTTPRPNARQAAFLVDRIDDVYPGVRPERIVDWSVDICRAIRNGERPRASDVEHLEAALASSAAPGTPDEVTLEQWVQHLFSGSGRPKPTFEQAEAIVQIVRAAGFCRPEPRDRD